MIQKKIGFIGCGNMGGAILKGGIASGVLNPANVFVYDVIPAAMERMTEMGAIPCANNTELVTNSDIILLCTKPQYTAATLASVGDALDQKAVISIVAGISTTSLENMAEGNVRVLRVMPNTPAMVFECASAFSSDTQFTDEEKSISEQLFNSIGIVEWVPEKAMDVVCGLSGGGPAYVAMFIEAMADGAVKQGLPRQTAYRLASQTVLGTAKLALETGMHPGQMKDMVTSPGGTTIEGCEALERGGMRFAVMDCVKAATEKSIKLGQEN